MKPTPWPEDLAWWGALPVERYYRAGAPFRVALAAVRAMGSR